MTELKPCPFCGWEATLKWDMRYPRPDCNKTLAFEVVCVNPECIIYNADDVYFYTPEEAIKAWNRRANDERN